MGRLGGFSEITGLTMCLCQETADCIQRVPVGCDLFSEELTKACVLDFRFQKRDQEHPIVMLFDPGFFLGVAQITESRYLILGPAPAYKLDRNDIYRHGRALWQDNILSVCDMLMSCPTFSLRRFSQAVAQAVFLTVRRDIPLEQIIFHNNTLREIPVEQMLWQAAFEMREGEICHTTFEWENKVFAAVELGDAEKLKSLVLGPMPGRAGLMSPDPIQQERYTFLSFITQATRAAIRGGVPYEQAYSLSDIYCQKMDRLHNVSDIDMLMFQAIFDFCRRVHDGGASRGISPPIRMCCDYIGAHLHESIHLDDLALHCGLSRRTISIRFKKETGMALPIYIHTQKIREAKYLLADSQYTLAEISSILQYSSQSYFTKWFRQIEGYTPNEYRSRLTY